MYDLLVKLMLIAGLTQLGYSLSQIENCRSRACWQTFEARSRNVLNVDWKPMTVFPEEARKFQARSPYEK